MDGLIVPIGIAVVGIVVIAILAAAAHRRRLQEIERRLAWSEQSRFDAEQHAEAMQVRMTEIQDAMRSSASERAQRHAELDRMLDRGLDAPPRVHDPAWIDTEPMVGSYIVPAYAPTMPADLEPELPRARPRTGHPA